jgi:hypothetical protein
MPDDRASKHAEKVASSDKLEVKAESGSATASNESIKADQKSGKADVDLFWLEKVFVEPEQIFSYKRPTLDSLVQDCLFVFDANVLLAPYLTGEKSLKDIETIYGSLAASDRLFAPAQAVREFGKHRARKVAEVYTQIHQSISKPPSVVSVNTPMLEGIPEYENLKSIAAEIKRQAREYAKNLATLKSLLSDWKWDDRVSELYRGVFTNDRIIRPSIDSAALRADLTRRVTYKIPPGYKDGGKLDEGVGDVLIWHTLLELGKKRKSSIVFVCNEEKADWFVRSSDAAIMPRPELTQEFFHETGKYFTIASWSNFLELMNADPGTVREAERVQEETLVRLSAAEEALLEPLTHISRMIGEFQEDWKRSFDVTRHEARPYIIDEDLDFYIRRFDVAALDIIRTCANSELHKIIEEIRSLLGGILDDNLTLEHIERRAKRTGDIELARLLSRCEHFVYLRSELLAKLVLKYDGVE